MKKNLFIYVFFYKGFWGVESLFIYYFCFNKIFVRVSLHLSVTVYYCLLINDVALLTIDSPKFPTGAVEVSRVCLVDVSGKVCVISHDTKYNNIST